MKKHQLDREEQEILDAIEGGKWEIIKPHQSELEHYAQIAKNTLRKLSSRLMKKWGWRTGPAACGTPASSPVILRAAGAGGLPFGVTRSQVGTILSRRI